MDPKLLKSFANRARQKYRKKQSKLELQKDSQQYSIPSPNKHAVKLFWVFYFLWSSVTLTFSQQRTKKLGVLWENCSCDGQIFMHGSRWNGIFSAFQTDNKVTVHKNINASIKTHELLDTKSSVMKKNVPSKSEPYLRFETLLLFLSLERGKGKKNSSHKSSINLNNHICRGLWVHLWQEEEMWCYVSHLLILTAREWKLLQHWMLSTTGCSQ